MTCDRGLMFINSIINEHSYMDVENDMDIQGVSKLLQLLKLGIYRFGRTVSETENTM